MKKDMSSAVIMGKFSSVTPLAYLILVSLILLTTLEISLACHRRVEYHHFYKKPPAKGHGDEGHGGYGYSSGGGYKGHKGWGQQHYGGGGHKGYGQQHGGGKGYGHQHGGGYKGYGQQHGGGHKGYGQQHGGEHKGYGQQHGGQDHYGDPYGTAHGHGGYGHGAGDEGYDSGHEQYGWHAEHGHGHANAYPHGNEGQHGAKGQKYKYAMYQSTHYNDKGGQQPHGGYSGSAPYYQQKGYGHSGPYPNTEYSTPVKSSVHAPAIPNLLGDAAEGEFPLHLDAADTADLIRNVFDTKENELVHPALGGGPQNEIPLPEMKVSPTSIGNFDLNVNYNSELPAPFRQNLFETPVVSSNLGKIRKKMSSKYRDNSMDSIMSFGHSKNEDDVSQSHPMSSGGTGPDYLENDMGASNAMTHTISDSQNNAKMNF